MKKVVFLSGALMLSVFGNSQNKNEIKYSEFDIRIGAINGGNTSIQEVLSSPTLTIKDNDATIVDYDISYTYKDGKREGIYKGPFHVGGAKFTDNVVADLKEMQNGRIFIENIHVKKGAKTVTNKSIIYSVKVK